MYASRWFHTIAPIKFDVDQFLYFRTHVKGQREKIYAHSSQPHYKEGTNTFNLHMKKKWGGNIVDGTDSLVLPHDKSALEKLLTVPMETSSAGSVSGGSENDEQSAQKASPDVEMGEGEEGESEQESLAGSAPPDQHPGTNSQQDAEMP